MAYISCPFCKSEKVSATGETRFGTDYYDNRIFYHSLCKGCHRPFWICRLTSNDGFSNINAVPMKLLTEEDCVECDDYRRFKCPSCGARGAMSDFRGRWVREDYIGSYCVCEGCSCRYVHFDKMATLGYSSIDTEDLDEYLESEARKFAKRRDQIFEDILGRDIR